MTKRIINIKNEKIMVYKSYNEYKKRKAYKAFAEEADEAERPKERVKTVKYKVNKEGVSVTYCPHGLTTYLGNRRKRVGDDCLMCKFRKHVDYDGQAVECLYVRRGRKET